MGLPGHLQLVEDIDSTTTTPRPGRTGARVAGTAARAVGQLLLTLAAIAGALCIAAVIAASLFGMSLVVFSTGSMSPTMPTGSVALVRTVPATEVRVGDVVTVPHPRSTAPVTHRVVAIEPDPDDPDVVVLTMKGDANESVDPFPYRVEEVRRVVASVPHVGKAMGVPRSPWALGTATIAVAVLVVWAFWPRAVEETAGDPAEDPQA
jgi:signal peptidase